MKPEQGFLPKDTIFPSPSALPSQSSNLYLSNIH
jgi:hypothetical protein